MNQTPQIDDPTTRPVAGASNATTEQVPYPLAVARRGWWRGLLAILGVVVVMLVGQILTFLMLLLGQVYPELNGGLVLGPIGILALNIGLILLIPGSLLLSKLLYGSARDLLSVVGRLRWGLMARAALVVLPVWAVFIGAGLVLGVQPPSPIVIVIMVICILTTPLQAAGEEMAFRGLLFRATATWAPRGIGIVVGMVVSSVLFSIAHFVPNPWMASYYFIFGLSLAIIAWRTGGLEVPILIHAVHNTFSFAVGLLTTGSVDALTQRNDIDPGPAMLVYDAVFLGAAAVTWLVTRRKKTA